MPLAICAISRKLADIRRLLQLRDFTQPAQGA
jgi:hypothetical protein